MSLIDGLIPAYYKVLRMEVLKTDEVRARYGVAILNAEGGHLDRLTLEASLTQEETDDIAAIFLRDKAAFEANTGLTEWIEPPEEP